MCKYRIDCEDYNPKECHCEPELCFLYEMFEEEARHQKRYMEMYIKREVVK